MSLQSADPVSIPKVHTPWLNYLGLGFAVFSLLIYSQALFASAVAAPHSRRILVIASACDKCHCHPDRV